jgi:hypothetical protein
MPDVCPAKPTEGYYEDLTFGLVHGVRVRP